MEISLILAVLSLILGIINSYFLYKNWILFSKKEEKNRPLIRIKKERNPRGTLTKKRGFCGLQVRIKNIGHLPACLAKVKILVGRSEERQFSPHTIEFPPFPLDIPPLKERKLNIYFKISDRMIKELTRNLPIKTHIKFEFTHVELEGHFLIGRKGIFRRDFKQ